MLALMQTGLLETHPDTYSGPAQVRLRFSATDNPNNSTTEAAIDAVMIAEYACTPVCTRGDVNLDGAVDGRDVPDFAAALLAPPPVGTTMFCAADTNGDEAVTLGDVEGFVACMLNGACQ